MSFLGGAKVGWKVIMAPIGCVVGATAALFVVMIVLSTCEALLR